MDFAIETFILDFRERCNGSGGEGGCGGGGEHRSRRKIQVFVVENSYLEGELNQERAEC